MLREKGVFNNDEVGGGGTFAKGRDADLGQQGRRPKERV